MGIIKLSAQVHSLTLKAANYIINVFCRTKERVKQVILLIIWIMNTIKYMERLDTHVKKLDNMKKQADDQLRTAPRTREDIFELVGMWQEDVPSILEVSKKLLNDDTIKCSLFGRRILELLAKRFKMGGDVIEVVEKTEAKIKEWNFDKIQALKVRDEELVNQILGDLQDDKVSVAGVYGAGGVGKTTLVNKLMVEARKRGVFNIVAKAVISEIVNEKRIQEEIAKGIGLSFEAGDENNHEIIGTCFTEVKTRAKKLKKRLERALNEKKRILIVLDNLCASKVDLYGSIGIPKGCKIVLSARSKDVYDQMDITGAITHKVAPLDPTQSLLLCYKLLRNSYRVEERPSNLKDKAEKLKECCHGLPLALKTLTKAAIDQHSRNGDPSTWNRVVDGLNVGSLLGIDPMDELVFKVVTVSFKSMTSSFMELFLGLCCLFPGDSTIGVEEIMRYGMGLGLFRDDEQINERIDKANSWAQVLKSLNMLLDVETESDMLAIKMHDSIRNGVIFTTLPDTHEFSVMMDPSNEKWTDGSLQRKYGISVFLTAQGTHKLPSDHKCQMLQILRLDCCSFKSNFSFDDRCFEAMEILKVLEIRNANFWKLPPQLGSLQQLVSLCLHDCHKVDELILTIANLSSLQVLSLRGSDVSAIPEDLGKLTRLRVLDLTRCTKLKIFCPEVITKLSNSLEGIYMLGSLNAEQASILVEKLSDCSKLKVLQMEIKLDDLCGDQLPFISSSFCFAIKTGRGLSPFLKELINGSLINPCYGSSRKVLELQEYDGEPRLYHSNLGQLLKEVKELQLYKMNGIKHIACLKLGDNLTQLYIDSCSSIEHIITHGNALSELTHLHLRNLPNIKVMCSDDIICEKALSKLKFLHIYGCNRLQYLPVGSKGEFPKQLETLDIRYCSSLESIFRTRERDHRQGTNTGTDDEMKLQCLRIWGAHRLRSFSSYVHTNGQLRISQSFFSEKDNLPDIKTLAIARVQLEYLWDKKMPEKSFTKLETLRISTCTDMKTVIPFSIQPNLQKLRELDISNCDKIEEIFENGDVSSVSTNSNAPSINIPLRELSLKNLYRMSHINLSNHMIQKLCYVSVGGCPRIESLFIAHLAKTLEQLTHLDVMDCNELVTVVVGGVDNEDIVFPRLQQIRLRSLNSLESFYSGSCFLRLLELDSLEIIDCPTLQRFCSKLIERRDCPKLTHVKLSSEKQIWKGHLNATIRHLYHNKVLANGQGEKPSDDDIKNLIEITDMVEAELRNIKKELQDPDKGRCIFSDMDEHKKCEEKIKNLLCIINTKEEKNFDLSLKEKQKSVRKELEALLCEIGS